MRRLHSTIYICAMYKIFRYKMFSVAQDVLVVLAAIHWRLYIWTIPLFMESITMATSSVKTI